MLFNSFNFWLIFPFIFVGYWIIPQRLNQLRNLFLVIISYLLYLNWNPAFAIVLLGVTLITYGGGIMLGKPNVETKGKYSVCSSPYLGYCPFWSSSTIILLSIL